MRHSYIAALIVCLALPAAADQVQDLISGKIKACQGCDLSGANFKKAFNVVGGAMGTPLGFGEGGEFGLRGRDFFFALKRNQTDITRNGG